MKHSQEWLRIAYWMGRQIGYSHRYLWMIMFDDLSEESLLEIKKEELLKE